MEKTVRDKLSSDEIKDVLHYYMYQDGRHPAVPAGTKLVFVKSGDFDEITNTKGNNILWYIPEQYLQQYLEDVQQTQGINKDETSIDRENEVGQASDENATIMITNADVEQELSEFYTDDITNNYLEVYLSEKISQIYGDRLGDAGIFNVKKFLDGKLDYFEGVESYRAIIEELESTLEAAESMREDEQEEVEHDEAESLLYKVEDRVDTVIKGMDDFEKKMYNGIDNIVEKTEQFVKLSFDQALLLAGFRPDTIAGLKSSIQTVSPRILLTMDSILGRTNEQTLSRGGNEDGNEQDDR